MSEIKSDINEFKKKKQTELSNVDEPLKKKQQSEESSIDIFEKVEKIIKNRGYNEHEEANFIFVIDNHKIYVTKFSIRYGLTGCSSIETSFLHMLMDNCTEKILICDPTSIQYIDIELFLDYLDILVHKNFKLPITNFKVLINLSHIFGTDLIDSFIMDEIFKHHFTYENIMHFAHNEIIFKQLVNKKIAQIRSIKQTLYSNKTIDVPLADDFALGSSLEAKNKAYFIVEMIKVLIKF